MHTNPIPQPEASTATTDTMEARESSPNDATPNPKAPAEQEALALLLKRAEEGDRSVLPELCAALDADKRLWKTYGNLALQAEAALGMLATGENLLLAESLKRTLRSMKDELCGPSPFELERLLVERVTATWLRVNFYDGLIAQAKDTTTARWKLLERQQDAAGRRHSAATKTLATVRKLLTPAPSPLEISRRMDSVGRRSREGFAGKVLVPN
jgi:hypothetical protein